MKVCGENQRGRGVLFLKPTSLRWGCPGCYHQRREVSSITSEALCECHASSSG